jgi:hypothetical protein
MKKYFRITVYNPETNVTAILDSNGYYDAIWKLSAFFVKNGWKVKAVAEDGQFEDGNIPRIQEDNQHIVLRACVKGLVEKNNGVINVLGRYYTDLR